MINWIRYSAGDHRNKAESSILRSLRPFALSVLVAIPGCVSIPPEAPELSVELGRRISSIEDSNITLLRRFFDQKRREVDEFIENEWVPEFAKQFFSNQTIAETWDTIVSEDDKEQRLLFLIKTGPKLQEKINEKRLELVRPLDDLERRIEARIHEEYDQARAMNNSITSFLLSASKVAENRNRYLELMGVTDETIGGLIDQTDDAVAELLSEAETAANSADRIGEFLNDLNRIRDSIR